jgi:UDP-N-acetylmuramoyl-tripeptide--D-alanyl-D-alanine ligase
MDFWAEDITVEKDWLYFRICDKTGESADFKVNLVGRQNIENILLATACTKELGMTLPEITKACEKIKSDQGTLRLVQSSALHNVDVIDSSYSANPDGVLAALEHLKLWTGSKIIIMPCLIELGPAAKEIHQKIGRKIGQICDLGIITTKDWFEEIKKTAVTADMKPENIIYSENTQEIFARIKNFNKPGDVILLEGRLSRELLDRFKNKTVPAI